jgi:hypothetical protein
VLLDKGVGPLFFPVFFMWFLGNLMFKMPYKTSRGLLVTSFVGGSLSPEMWIKQFRRRMKGFGEWISLGE